MKLTLKSCRVNVNATVGEMAKAIGVTEDTIYNWEKGKYAPTARHMQKIFDFYASKNFYITINDIKFLP